MNKYRVLIVDGYPDAAEAMWSLVKHLGHDGRFTRSRIVRLAAQLFVSEPLTSCIA
jgi:hypothetical protein